MPKKAAAKAPKKKAATAQAPLPAAAALIPSPAPAMPTMNPTPVQKSVIERVLNAFETGSADGDYANISIFHDGPHQIRQITYGRSQTTEYGHLGELVSLYAGAGGTFSAQLAAFVPQVGHVPLVDNDTFKNLLRRAGSEDPVMRTVQDHFFDAAYYQPALKWAQDNAFTEGLSMLVIYDSYIHSGGILGFLRSRFPEVPPVSGGNERTWISQYVGVRQDWLASAANPALHTTVYRTQCFKREIARGNWDLSQLPINANGVLVRPAAAPGGGLPANITPVLADPSGGVHFLGNPGDPAGHGPNMPGLPTEAAAAPAPAASAFVGKAVQEAEEQWRFFGQQTYNLQGTTTHAGHKEGEDGYWQRVGQFWTEIGRNDLDGRDHDWPWSAAFISHVMRKAGAGTLFPYSSSHATYISKSIRDRNQGNRTTAYWGYRLSEEKPRVGDLICWDRDPDKKVTYDNQFGGDYKSHTDLVVSVSDTQIEVIGGNVGNSVTRRPIALDASGHLPEGTIGGETLFALMRCLLT